MLKDYDTSALYHPGKGNIFCDALIRMTMGSASHVNKSKKDLLKHVHGLSRLRVKYASSPNGGSTVHYSSG